MKKGRMRKLQVKAVTAFSDIGVIMIQWVPEGQTVNQKYCLEVLTKLQDQVRKKAGNVEQKNHGFSIKTMFQQTRL
jgi:hypothetical protein